MPDEVETFFITADLRRAPALDADHLVMLVAIEPTCPWLLTQLTFGFVHVCCLDFLVDVVVEPFLVTQWDLQGLPVQLEDHITADGHLVGFEKVIHHTSANAHSMLQ